MLAHLTVLEYSQARELGAVAKSKLDLGADLKAVSFFTDVKHVGKGPAMPRLSLETAIRRFIF